MSDTDALALLIEVNRSRPVVAGLDVFLHDHLTRDVTCFDEWRNRFSGQARGFADRGVEAAAKGLDATAREAFKIATLASTSPLVSPARIGRRSPSF